MTKKMVFQLKLFEKSTFFIVKMTGLAMVLPASSNFWKAPLVYLFWQKTLLSTHKIYKKV